MKPTVYLALFGWPVVAPLLFLVMRPRRAVIASVILAWLFLPVTGFKMAGLPAYTKITATVLGVLPGILVFDLRKLITFRPSWVDLPMGLWCLCPVFSSLSNDLGFGDGFSSMFYQTITWGVPYFLGRLYFSDLIGMHDLAIGIFIGGLLYVPPCLLEIRLSPQLHTWIYGFYQNESFDQTLRYGGFRPTVFMEHGLMVAMWMSMASLCGLWLWYSRTLRSIFRIALPWFLVPLVGTTILCKSMGALVLLLVGVFVLMGTRYGKTRAFVAVLACAPILYFALRIPAIWSGAELTQAAAAISPERAKSLQFRLTNEDMLLDRAMLHPLLGWGGWGRARVRDTQGRDISVTDGLWIIALGNNGLLGLGALSVALVIPILGLFRRIPLASWPHALAAPAVVLCVMVLLYFVDCIFNDMKNPAFVMAGGGLVCLRIGKVMKSPPKLDRAEDVQWAPGSSS
jgi:hypothetical protein